MFKSVNSLLFATNLSENCRPALEAAVALAAQCQATLVLLYVIGLEAHGGLDNYVRVYVGEKRWKEVEKEIEEDVSQTLTGKMTSKNIVENVVRKDSKDAGIDTSGINWETIVVENTEVTEEILNQASINNCDLIILGDRKGFLGSNAVGSKIKAVLRNSKIPVMVVPSGHNKQ